jgi:hypothetical protein
MKLRRTPGLLLVRGAGGHGAPAASFSAMVIFSQVHFSTKLRPLTRVADMVICMVGVYAIDYLSYWF